MSQQSKVGLKKTNQLDDTSSDEEDEPSGSEAATFPACPDKQTDYAAWKAFHIAAYLADHRGPQVAEGADFCDWRAELVTCKRPLDVSN